jgi:hypothetical protein
LAPLLVALSTAALLFGSSTTATAAQTTDSVPTARVTYYVNCSSHASGSGTSSSAPWNSLNAINSHGAFNPGDRILVKRGTTCRGRVHPSGSGNAAAPIVLGAYGSGARPTIAGGGTPNKTGAVQLTNSAYWTIQDLHVTNATTSKSPKTYRAGILLLDNHHGWLHGITVQRTAIEKVVSNPAYTSANPRQWGGISALTSGGVNDGFVGMRLMNNQITNVSRTGIAVINVEYSNGRDKDLRISGNVIRRAKGDSIIVQGASKVRIDHNTSALGASFWPCAQCKGISPQTANAGIWPIYSDGIQIDHNEVYGEHAKGGDGEAFSLDASARNVTLEYNYVHDNEGGGVLFCGSVNATVRFNIFENNAKSAIAFIGTYPAKNSSIYNNTIYASAKTRASVVRTFNGKRGSGVSFKNNIVYSYGSGSYSWPTKKVTTAANTLIGNRGAGRPHDRRTSYTNPRLRAPGTGKTGFGSLSGYKPRSHAKAQKGVAIPKSITKDFFGRTINPKKPPRGAAG